MSSLLFEKKYVDINSIGARLTAIMVTLSATAYLINMPLILALAAKDLGLTQTTPLWLGGVFLGYPSSDYPLRVVQGDHDKTVDWQYNLKVLRKKFCNIKIELIHSAQHHMVNEAPLLRSSVFRCLD